MTDRCANGPSVLHYSLIAKGDESYVHERHEMQRWSADFSLPGERAAERRCEPVIVRRARRNRDRPCVSVDHGPQRYRKLGAASSVKYGRT